MMVHLIAVHEPVSLRPPTTGLPQIEAERLQNAAARNWPHALRSALAPTNGGTHAGTRFAGTIPGSWVGQSQLDAVGRTRPTVRVGLASEWRPGHWPSIAAHSFGPQCRHGVQFGLPSPRGVFQRWTPRRSLIDSPALTSSKLSSRDASSASAGSTSASSRREDSRPSVSAIHSNLAISFLC
jgi:hypothetical protein